MRIISSLAMVAMIGLGACTTVSGSGAASRPVAAPQQTVSRLTVPQARMRLAPVIRRIEPVAERECRARTRGTNCDFLITVDSRRNQPPNAYQTLKSGRPYLVLTAALVSSVYNDDELAFVMGHEAAHHIAGHLARQKNDAMTGAVIGSVLATLAGASASTADSMMDIGAQVGARSFSKDYELEADRLGTVIAARAGYDPVHGAAYFTRIPDPGNQFLGTHPPNSQRIETVKRTASAM